MDFRPCVLVPTHDNHRTVRSVVERARVHLGDVLVVDDGSGAEARGVLDALVGEGVARVHRRSANGGKGRAVKDGFRFAETLGFTHALQIDADGQHCIDDIPRFLDAARERPDALVLGSPVFDASAPRLRLKAREITRFFSRIEAGGRVIDDPMCGFRVYPLRSAMASGARGDAMDFDPEIAVRMAWMGVPVVNLPTRVRYISREDGGVSHFRMFRDNALISWMHTRLLTLRVLRYVGLWRPKALP